MSNKEKENHQPAEEYNLLNFLAYTYYLPFFMAGPVVTFNAFIAQVFNFLLFNPEDQRTSKNVFNKTESD